MKKILLSLFLLASSINMFAQDAYITELFGASAEFYAQQFDGQKYLIMKFKESAECIPLSQTTIKVLFADGTIAKWDGFCVNSKVNASSSTINTQYSSSTSVDEKVLNVMRFDLTENDVNSLSKGISKISIYTVPKVFRKEYTKDKLGIKLYEAFQKANSLF